MHSDRPCQGTRWQYQVPVSTTLRFYLLLWAILFSLISGKVNTSAFSQPAGFAEAKAGTGYSPQININRATVAELKTLPGIGDATARRIVEYRMKNPPFRRLEELLIIRGISRTRLEQLRNRIRVD